MNSNGKGKKEIENYDNLKEEIDKLYKQIKEINFNMNKKEDDIKNILTEKDIIIQELNNKLKIQENILKENKNEISFLNNRMDEIINKFTNNLKENK